MSVLPEDVVQFGLHLRPIRPSLLHSSGSEMRAKVVQAHGGDAVSYDVVPCVAGFRNHGVDITKKNECVAALAGGGSEGCGDFFGSQYASG